MSWAPGTIVVCVDDVIRNPVTYIMARPSAPLVKGALYTIRYIGPAISNGETLVLLNEIRCNRHFLGDEYGWAPERFRKAEGGACEAERARAMKPQEQNK